jgi:CheY-like chemotaxis protein
VLLVEDDLDTRDLYAHYLKAAGIDVRVASNGVEALGAAATFLPHVIVMDLELPLMDGFEATRYLKANPRTAHVPVIAVTAYVAIGEVMAPEAGCDVFLAKPLLPDLLVHHVTKQALRNRLSS